MKLIADILLYLFLCVGSVCLYRLFRQDFKALKYYLNRYNDK